MKPSSQYTSDEIKAAAIALREFVDAHPSDLVFGMFAQALGEVIREKSDGDEGWASMYVDQVMTLIAQRTGIEIKAHHDRSKLH